MNLHWEGGDIKGWKFCIFQLRWEGMFTTLCSHTNTHIEDKAIRPKHPAKIKMATDSLFFPVGTRMTKKWLMHFHKTLLFLLEKTVTHPQTDAVSVQVVPFSSRLLSCLGKQAKFNI